MVRVGSDLGGGSGGRSACRGEEAIRIRLAIGHPESQPSQPESHPSQPWQQVSARLKSASRVEKALAQAGLARRNATVLLCDVPCRHAAMRYNRHALVYACAPDAESNCSTRGCGMHFWNCHDACRSGVVSVAAVSVAAPPAPWRSTLLRQMWAQLGRAPPLARPAGRAAPPLRACACAWRGGRSPLRLTCACPARTQATTALASSAS